MYTGTLMKDLANTVASVDHISPYRVTFHAPGRLRKRMEETATECHTSLSELARVSVEFYLEHLETEAR